MTGPIWPVESPLGTMLPLQNKLGKQGVDILAKGPSLILWEPSDRYVIGLNDIWRADIKPDMGVFIDAHLDGHIEFNCPPDLRAELYVGMPLNHVKRLGIRAHEAEYFGTEEDIWNWDFSQPIPHWNFTVFFAVQLALGMTEGGVHCWGWDMWPRVGYRLKQWKRYQAFVKGIPDRLINHSPHVK